nr:immunoglobulin heavy chain junction region [Mus musculus]
CARSSGYDYDDWFAYW